MMPTPGTHRLSAATVTAPRLPARLLGFILLLAGSLSASYSHAADSSPAATDKAEFYPGGSSSQPHRADRNSFSKPAATLDLTRKLDFEVGRALFEKLWVFAPSSTTASDGLGPLYNARTCAGCHQRNGRGRPYAENTDVTGSSSKPQRYPVDQSLLLKLSRGQQPLKSGQLNTEEQQMLHERGSLPDPTYGQQLQPFAWPGADAEGRAYVRYETENVRFSDDTLVKLRRPRYTIENLSDGPLHPHTRISARLTPPMIGLGLLEAIPEATIRQLADPEDKDDDGISGRVNEVWDRTTGQPALGRFGWKATAPTLDQQNLDALNQDLGISSWLHPAGWGDCTPVQQACRAAPHGNTDTQDGLEASRIVSDVLLLFTRNVAVPVRQQAETAEVLAGRALFAQTGCQNCHQPSFTTANRADMPEQSEQQIWPYTDLLLHDMGADLADSHGEFGASGREWRTPPLWGLGLTVRVNGYQAYLHDGRARTLMEAILWHGGEAAAARQQVLQMNAEQRTQLVKFLESL